MFSSNKSLWQLWYSGIEADFDNLIFSIGVIFAGALFLIVSDLLMQGFTIVPLWYAMFAWISLRFISAFSRISNTLFSKTQLFSIVFLVYFLIACTLGYFHLSIPLDILFYFSTVDLCFFIVSNFRRMIKKELFYWWVLALFFGVFFCIKLTTTYGTPWFSYLSPMGIGYIDTFRDAAIIMAWKNYGHITHGTHGLLFTPYHSLLVQFHSAFLANTHGNAFEHLQYYSFAVAPALFFYGIIRLIELIAHKTVVKYKYFYAIGFALTCSAIHYSVVQRSTMAATFLTISSMPMLIEVWKDRSASIIPLVILAIITPLMLYARVFHGLVLLAVLAPLILDRKPRWKSIIPLVGCGLGGLVLFFFYASQKRNLGMHFDSIDTLWTKHLLYINVSVVTGLFLISIMVGLIYLWKIKQDEWIVRFNDAYSRLIALSFTSILGVNFIVLKCNSYTDIFYTTILMAWIVFYVLITERVFPDFQQLLIRCYHFIKLRLIRFFGVEIIVIRQKNKQLCSRQGKAIIGLIVLAFYLNINHGIKEIKTHLNYTLHNHLDIKLLTKQHSLHCRKDRYDPFCKHRMRKYNVADFNWIAKQTIIKQMGDVAFSIKQSIPGTTAIYVVPQHAYWKFFQHDTRYASLYFMAEFGLPIIYGLNSDNTGYGFSVVRYNNGQLKSLQAIGGVKNLCKTAASVHIDNIIIFTKKLQHKVIICRQQ